jgi:hypothetical protein
VWGFKEVIVSDWKGLNPSYMKNVSLEFASVLITGLGSHLPKDFIWWVGHYYHYRYPLPLDLHLVRQEFPQLVAPVLDLLVGELVEMELEEDQIRFQSSALHHK